MLTVTQLARLHNISRTTVLYYERVGLLAPKHRDENGYRWYGDNEISKLKDIVGYRAFGLSINDIKRIVESLCNDSQSSLLVEQFNNLANEIQTLKQQQQAIVVALQAPEMLEKKVVSKERWVEIMKSLGFDSDDRVDWHRNFEKMKPHKHLEFLESLGLTSDEISHIRHL